MPKKRKGHKQTAKLPDDLPDDFGFLWTIDTAEPIYDERHQPRILGVGSSKGNDVAKLWFPPVKAKLFKREKGNLYRWRKWGSEMLDEARPKEKLEVASVFFQTRQDNYIAVAKDCTRYDISEEDFGWGYIGFHHHLGGISEVDFAGAEFRLASPANGSSWMPQVIPEVYNYPRTGPSIKYAGEFGGLCGKLSLLIAMAAFSAEVHNAEATVSQCFTDGIWTKHSGRIGIGRYIDRGVVVSIYQDPDAPEATPTLIKAYEDGIYGAIFDTPEETDHYTAQPAGAHPVYPNVSQSIPRSFQSPAATSEYPEYATHSTYTAPIPSEPENIYDAEDQPEEAEE